jgi:hypothetical protein
MSKEICVTCGLLVEVEMNKKKERGVMCDSCYDYMESSQLQNENQEFIDTETK